MRIVGGSLGGRRLQPPANIPARPTTERAREGLMNMLRSRMEFQDKKVLELFAGTGAVSFELASHLDEKSRITAVEVHPQSAAFILSTAEVLGVGDALKVVRSDAFRFLKQNTDQYDLVFADPPYDLPGLADLPDLILTHKRLKPGGLFILEHRSKDAFDQHPRFAEARSYGEATFSFFK